MERELAGRTLAAARVVAGTEGLFRAGRFAGYPLGELTENSKPLRVWVDASPPFDEPVGRKIEDIGGERVLTVDCFKTTVASSYHTGRSFAPNPLIPSSKNYRVKAEMMLESEYTSGGELGVFIQGETGGVKSMLMGRLSSFVFGSAGKRLVIQRMDTWGNNVAAPLASISYDWRLDERYTLVFERIAQTIRLKAWKTLLEPEPDEWQLTHVLAPGAFPNWDGIAGVVYCPGNVYRSPIPAHFYDVQIDGSDSRSQSTERDMVFD